MAFVTRRLRREGVHRRQRVLQYSARPNGRKTIIRKKTIMKAANHWIRVTEWTASLFGALAMIAVVVWFTSAQIGRAHV